MFPPEVLPVTLLFAFAVHLIIGVLFTSSVRSDIKDRKLFSPKVITSPRVRSLLRKIVFVVGWIPVANVALLAIMLGVLFVGAIWGVLQYIKTATVEVFTS